MSLFGDIARESAERELAAAFRKRRRYLKRCQRTQREGGVAWKQWQQAINENCAMFEYLQREGLIPLEERWEP